MTEDPALLSAEDIAKLESVPCPQCGKDAKIYYWMADTENGIPALWCPTCQYHIIPFWRETL